MERKRKIDIKQKRLEPVYAAAKGDHLHVEIVAPDKVYKANRYLFLTKNMLWILIRSTSPYSLEVPGCGARHF